MTVSWACHDGLLCGPPPIFAFPLIPVAASPSVKDFTLFKSSDSVASDGSSSSSVKNSLLLDDSLLLHVSRASVEDVASCSPRPS
jgi:hypothetical protein